ncbi:DUF6252 family protein [Flavobacterium sp.]|uniref:DUF6252 family protein n=1 Tax=Flavobacterium sp. TaxID=239 RepID=UPI0026261AD6|nr:DUF6252 family protein [Flavobacterium sp.]
MKKFKFILFIAVTTIFGSCSSDSDSSSSTDEYFNYKIAGETITITDWIVNRSEDSFEVVGTNSNEETIYFEFNAQGNIGSVTTYSPNDLIEQDRSAQNYYTNQSFDFNLVSINESSKMIKVTYSGKVYEDEYDTSSDFVLVQGDFQVKYTDLVPQVAGLGVFAKIAGTDFYSSSGDQTGGFFPSSNITLNSYDGGIYSIGVTTNHDNTTTGSYNFTPASSTNKVTLSKYNTTLNYFESLDCTGSVNITSKQVGSQLTVISGTYSFTAINPDTGEETQVTNGTFKDVYSNY